MTRLGTQAQNIAGRVIACQRREVNAGNGAQQPGRLPFFLDGTTRGYGSGPSLHRTAVDTHLAHPVHIQWHTWVADRMGYGIRKWRGIRLGSSFGCGHRFCPLKAPGKVPGCRKGRRYSYFSATTQCYLCIFIYNAGYCQAGDMTQSKVLEQKTALVPKG